MTDNAKPAVSSTVRCDVLRACPFCGGAPRHQTIGVKYIECGKCGARGPWFQDALDTHYAIDRAVAGWNHRTENARLQGCERSEHTLQGVVRHSDSGGEA